MRIGPPIDCIPAYVAPVPAVPLSPEVSKALIESGVFAHDANIVMWRQAGGASAAEPRHAVELPGGVGLQACRAGAADDSLLATFFDAGKQALPVLEQSGADAVADGVALMMASPQIVHALAGEKRWAAENLMLYGNNAVRMLKIANKAANIPHADTALDVVAGIFKVGEQVFLAAERRTAEK
ncbi:MAG TPA: hypothetical protein VHD85_06060 [Terracidiphilus sp.]|nr:hypothetical protein [Terracidiphilus sp.]